MSASEDKLPSQASTEEVEKILQAADAATAAEDWERVIALYRKLLSFDRVIQGAEAKLQWALRMRDIDNLYKQGKAHLETQRYADALAALRKARLMYASHYKDVDALIVQAQTALQRENWQARPQTASSKKGCFPLGIAGLAILLGGALTPFVIFSILFLSGCASATPSSPPNPTASAAKLGPLQRSSMYPSAPPMTIDVNKSYVATIKTNKGNIVVGLYPKDAPQTVNNFVFLSRDGFYNNLTFHRVEPGFVIQGGDPQGTGRGGPGYTLPAEIKVKHTQGAIAMARLPDQVNPKRDSSGSQFYITLEATPFLDGGYTAFGQVTQGMDVVQKIAVGDVIQTITIEEK